MRQCCCIRYSLNVLKMDLHSIESYKATKYKNQNSELFHKYHNNFDHSYWALINSSFSRSLASCLSKSLSLRLWASYSLYKKYPLPKTPAVTKTFLLCLLQRSLYWRKYNNLIASNWSTKRNVKKSVKPNIKTKAKQSIR